MSIMSDTYLMKQNGKYIVFRCGSFMFPSDWKEAAKDRNRTVFSLMSNNPYHLKAIAKPLATVDETEAIKIADADHSLDDGNAGYSPYAGDSCYMFDMDNKKAYHRQHERRPDAETRDKKTVPYLMPGRWEELNT